MNDLRRVGVTTVWPTPLLTTNKDDFNIAETKDALQVDPRFGTEADLKALIERAHDLSTFFQKRLLEWRYFPQSIFMMKNTQNLHFSFIHYQTYRPEKDTSYKRIFKYQNFQ